MNEELKKSAQKTLIDLLFTEMIKSTKNLSDEEIVSFFDDIRPALEKHLKLTWNSLSEL